LREALARSDHDFVLSEPRQRGGRRRPGTLGILMKCLVGCLRIAYRCAAYPNRVAAALLVMVLAAILVNALLLQRSPHPAPLFGRSLQSSPAPSPAAQSANLPTATIERPTADTEPKTTARETTRDPIGDLLKPAGAPRAQPPVNLRKHAAQEPEGKQVPEMKPVPTQDPISQLLKTNAPQAQSPASPEPSKTVLGVQRALVKLGFVLKPDGLNGAATRHAIEQFEHDHGLPAKGELTPKVLHELATQSGQPIE
jgi:hypothetical protein